MSKTLRALSQESNVKGHGAIRVFTFSGDFYPDIPSELGMLRAKSGFLSHTNVPAARGFLCQRWDRQCIS